MKQLTVLMMCGVLVACAGIKTEPTADANGKNGYRLSCSEFNTTLAQCKAKASELCGGDFKMDPHLSYRETYPDSGDGIHMPARQYLVVSCLE